jgi:hypothetical protein
MPQAALLLYHTLGHVLRKVLTYAKAIEHVHALLRGALLTISFHPVHLPMLLVPTFLTTSSIAMASPDFAASHTCFRNPAMRRRCSKVRQDVDIGKKIPRMTTVSAWLDGQGENLQLSTENSYRRDDANKTMIQLSCAVPIFVYNIIAKQSNHCQNLPYFLG